jgi:paraquat-inducible protein B
MSSCCSPACGFGSLASAHPEPGLLAFAAVVVPDAAGAHSFDPRMIWRDGPDAWLRLPRKTDPPLRRLRCRTCRGRRSTGRAGFGLSLVWLVPIVALLVAGSLFVRTVILVGPRIDIEFATADGIEPGKTDVRYKEVVVGKVQTVSLRGDRKRVIVTVRLDRSAAGLAVKDTQFWVVRPRIGAGGISGLGTLLSGAYIGTDAGVSTESRESFVGLEGPPFVLRGEPGSVFVLRADDLGSIEVGSPVLYRRTRVGRVVGYTLDPAIDEIAIRVFVEAPFHTLVTSQARFWNASGVDLRLSASGLTLNAQSVATVLAGGIAFELPPGSPKAEPARPDSRFVLFNDRRAALAPEDGPPIPIG